MRKHILLLTLFGALFALPAVAAEPTAEVPDVGIVAEAPAPTVTISGSRLRVQNGAGLTLEVYNVTGVRVFSAKITAGDQAWDLSLGRGCYIVKVGKTVRKISVL